MEKLGRKKRRHSTKRIPHETLTRNRRRRRFAIAVRGKGVTRLKDKEDTNGDQNKGNERSNPMQEGILSETVNKQTDRQPHGTEQGPVKPGFRRRDTVLGHDGVIFPDLEEVEPKPDCSTQTEGDVGEAGDALAPALLFLEGDRDDREEEEGQEPGEGDPETEGEDNGLCDEHLAGLDGGVVEHGLDIRGFEV